MADIKVLFTIENFQNDFNDDLLKSWNVVQEITSHRTPVVDIVTALENVLTNENKDVRRRGVEFVSWLLFQLPKDFLSPTEIKFFATFLCNQLTDHHSFIPGAIKSLLALINMKNTMVDSAYEIIYNIFQMVTCQAQVVKDRNNIYQLIRDCMTLHPACLEKFDAKLMCNIIASIEGETDPQNLLLLFSFLPQLFARVQEELPIIDVHEVFSTYFPVDFTTVKKDNIVITREDLAEGLGRCLAATPKLAAKCIPVILEKLDSTFKTAKIDSYKLLQRCCERLDGSYFESSLNQLWRVMHKDLLPALDPDIQRECLSALSALTAALNNHDLILEKFLDDIIIAVRSFATKPSDSLFAPAMKILEALCPQSNISARRSFLELEVLCRPNVHSECDVQVILTAVVPFISYMTAQEPALQCIGALALQTVVANEELRPVALLVLQKLVPGLASVEPWRQQVCAAILLVMRTSNSAAAISGCCQLCRLLTKSYPLDTIQTVYAELEQLYSSGELSINLLLDMSAALVDIPNVSQRVLQQYIIFGKSAEHSEIALASLLKAATASKCPQFRSTLSDTVMELVVFWNSSGTIVCLQTLSHLLKEGIQCLDATQQATLLQSVECHRVLSDACSADQHTFKRSITLLEGFLGALWPDVSIPNYVQLVERAQWYALNSDFDEARESSSRLLAAIVNKTGDMNVLNNLASLVKSETNCYKSVRLFCWALKGALLGGIPKLEPFLLAWFSLLDRPSSSNGVATGTKLLLDSDPVFLNESCHCTVRYLYRQRLFTYLPEIARKLVKLEDINIKNNYLITALELCTAAPPPAILFELDNIALVVSQAMQSTDSQVVEPALNLLLTLLKEKSSLFLDHSNSLLNTLLELSKPPASLQVRRTSLKCIFLSGFYPTTLILPYRKQVIRGLTECLDDHKRLVRSEAGRARQKWSLVGAAGEDEIYPQ